MHFLLSIALFIKCGYPLLLNEMNNIINQKIKSINQNKTKRKNNNLLSKVKTNRKKANKTKSNFPPKKYNLNFVNNVNFLKTKSNNKKENRHVLSGLNIKNKGLKKNTSNNLNNKVLHAYKKNEKNVPHLKSVNKEIKVLYNDYELNSFDYRNALLYDKRTFFEYYLVLIKTKNIILFSFCPRKDYNSIIIRSCIFSLSFSIYYAINFAFFNDDTLHKIYEEGGKYDIFFFLQNIIISFIISYYITIIIKIIFLSERNIIQVRKQSSLSLAYSIFDKEKKNLIIKYTIFFISGLIFLVFFWMLLSSFGAVYINTQMFIFKNALISFAMSLLYPFLFSIFPSVFRICSLRSNKKDNECIYKISKFLQML